MKIKVLFFSLVLSISAIAGKGGGGGDGVLESNGEWNLLDLAEEHSFPEYYFPNREESVEHFVSKAAVIANDYCSMESAVAIITYSGIRGYNDPGEKYLPHQNRMKIVSPTSDSLVFSLTDSNLVELEDEGTILTRDVKTKKQLAIQKGKRVVVYKPIFNALTDRKKAALLVHEALLRSAIIHNPSFIKNGTKNIRRLVNFIFHPDIETIHRHEFDKLCDGRNSITGDARVR